MSEIIKIEDIADHVVEVVINRPENYNTFNTELRLSLAKKLRKIDQNKDTRIVILKGEGPGIGRALTELITTGEYQSIDISNMAVERVLGKKARPEPYVL